MGNPRRDFTDEDIGMRAYQLRKTRATEDALDRIRQGLGGEWATLSEPDIDDLGWILGELWAYEKRADWLELHFSKLAREDIGRICALAATLRAAPHDTVETLEHVGDIVRAANQA